MELKRAQVHMLSTGDKSHILRVPESGIIYYHKELCSKGLHELKHLYFTTDEGSKKGEWVYQTVTKHVIKALFDTLDDFRFRKIVASTDPILTQQDDEHSKFKNLPRPSSIFIEKYCKEGGIDEVNVEYIISTGNDYSVTPPVIREMHTIKVDSHNTITTHPIKDTWNREEVEKLFYTFSKSKDLTNILDENLEHLSTIVTNRWIKENL